VQGRTWNLKSGISEFGILAPSKFHDVEIPRFQQKSWNREFEAHTRNFGIWNPSSLLLANSKFPDSQFQFRPPAFFCKLEIPRFPIPIPAPSAPCKLEIPRFPIRAGGRNWNWESGNFEFARSAGGRNWNLESGNSEFARSAGGRYWNCPKVEITIPLL
jgi:hypothetical protein